MRNIMLLLVLIVLLPSVAATQSRETDAPTVDPVGYGDIWVTEDTPIYETPSRRPALFPFITRTPAESSFMLQPGEAVRLIECRTEDSMQWFRVNAPQGTGWIRGNEYIRSSPQAATGALEFYAEFLRYTFPNDPEVIAKTDAVLNSLQELKAMVEAKGIQP